MCRRRGNRCTVIIPMACMATTSRPRHSPARRTLSELRRFSSPGTRLRGGRRFCAALLAEWWRARSTASLSQGDETDDAKLFTIVGVVGAVKQAALTEAAGTGRGLPAFLLPRQQQRLRRHAHEPASGSVRGRRCENWSAPPIPSSRSTTSARWTRGSTTA